MSHTAAPSRVNSPLDRNWGSLLPPPRALGAQARAGRLSFSPGRHATRHPFHRDWGERAARAARHSFGDKKRRMTLSRMRDTPLS